MRCIQTIVLALFAFTIALAADSLRLPLKEDSLRFAVIGDSGTGDRNQLAVARQLAAWRSRFPFELTVMLGDNLYGSESASAFAKKFEIPYRPLLDAGVKFYAALGNHDEPTQRFYKPFNMNGAQYYTFRPKQDVRFFALDSNYLDRRQLSWLEKELAASTSEWKIAFFHHPLYSSGETHGSADLAREQLEPIFVKHGVDVVFSGHEHFYERLKPQKGIAYFIAGASGKVRRGDLRKGSPLTAKGWDQGYSFMLLEVADDEMHFQAVSERGETIDAGVIRRNVGATTTGARPTGAKATAPGPR
jgi:predicted phosphodiesterase